MARQRGSPVLGAISGLVVGIGLAAILLLLAVMPLDNPFVVILPVLGLVIGILGGVFAPLTFLRRQAVAGEGPALDELPGDHAGE